MRLTTKIYLVGFVLILAGLVIVPIHTAHQYYRLSYADVLHNLIVDHRFGPR